MLANGCSRYSSFSSLSFAQRGSPPSRGGAPRDRPSFRLTPQTGQRPRQSSRHSSGRQREHERVARPARKLEHAVLEIRTVELLRLARLLDLAGVHLRSPAARRRGTACTGPSSGASKRSRKAKPGVVRETSTRASTAPPPDVVRLAAERTGSTRTSASMLRPARSAGERVEVEDVGALWHRLECSALDSTSRRARSELTPRRAAGRASRAHDQHREARERSSPGQVSAQVTSPTKPWRTASRICVTGLYLATVVQPAGQQRLRRVRGREQHGHEDAGLHQRRGRLGLELAARASPQ